MLQNIKKAMQDSLVYGVGNMAAKLVGFILLPLYTSRLSVADYGILSVLEITSQLIISVFGLSLYQGFNRWYWDPDLKDKQKSVFFTVFTTLVLMAFTTAVFLMIGAVPLSALLFKAAKFERVIKLMAIASAIQIVAVLPMTLLKLQSRSVFYTVATLSQFTVLVATGNLVARLNQK
jgi:O-antigen/teichoic acid export membrane protein